jgi:hypothetical protein
MPALTQINPDRGHAAINGKLPIPLSRDIIVNRTPLRLPAKKRTTFLSGTVLRHSRAERIEICNTQFSATDVNVSAKRSPGELPWTTTQSS